MTTLINADTSGGLKLTSDTSGTLEIQSAGSTKLTVSSTGVDIPAIGTINGLTSINGGQVGGRRNIVYNGEMKVAQRSASVAGLGAASGYFTLDRWEMAVGAASAGRFTMAQVADGPAGFANCLKLTTTTADTSLAAAEVLVLRQKFEGQDLQQLKKGTASAEQVTVSFYVKGNAAALYVCELFDVDNGRSIQQSFAVTTVWNRIELTFAADTSDPLDDDNDSSLRLQIWLHAGSDYTSGTFTSNTWADNVTANRVAVDGFTSIFDSTDRTFFITGVQMELGATATAFESRSYGEELTLCRRYCERYTAPTSTGFRIPILGIYNSTTQLYVVHRPRTSFRTTPSLSYSTLSDFDIEPFDVAPTAITIGTSSSDFVVFIVTDPSARTVGFCGAITLDQSGGFIQFDAEL
jgi:hypothetical protein